MTPAWAVRAGITGVTRRMRMRTATVMGGSVPGVPGAPPEEEVQAQAAKREAGPAAEHQIHVRGIGVEGWDGTEDGVGTYENEVNRSPIPRKISPR